MIDWLVQNWGSVLFVLLGIIGIILLFRFGAKKQVDEILFYLVTKAEQEFGNGTGELKFASVVTWLYDKLPIICRWLFTQKQIDGMIEEAVERMKEYLSKNEYASKKIL